MAQYAKAGTLYEIGLQQLGQAMVQDSLRWAAVVLAHATTPTYVRSRYGEEYHEAMREAIAFLRGSGLEVVIETFGLPLDAQELRHTFYTWCHKQQSHP